MNRSDLLARTRRFAVDVLRFCAAQPARPDLGVVARQLMRSATSVGANYRSACRARSRRDFVAKLGVVEEEADESLYRLELLRDIGARPIAELDRLYGEAGQIVAIFVSSRRTAREGLLADLELRSDRRLKIVDRRLTKGAVNDYR